MGPPNRSTDSVIYVYCTAEQKKRIAAAAAELASTLPGAKLATHAFVLQAALEKAEAVLNAQKAKK